MISICISCLFELSLLLHKLGSVLSRQPRGDEKRPREVKQLAQRYIVNLCVWWWDGWGGLLFELRSLFLASLSSSVMGSHQDTIWKINLLDSRIPFQR